MSVEEAVFFNSKCMGLVFLALLMCFVTCMEYLRPILLMVMKTMIRIKVTIMSEFEWEKIKHLRMLFDIMRYWQETNGKGFLCWIECVWVNYRWNYYIAQADVSVIRLIESFLLSKSCDSCLNVCRRGPTGSKSLANWGPVQAPKTVIKWRNGSHYRASSSLKYFTNPWFPRQPNPIKTIHIVCHHNIRFPFVLFVVAKNEHHRRHFDRCSIRYPLAMEIGRPRLLHALPQWLRVFYLRSRW